MNHQSMSLSNKNPYLNYEVIDFFLLRSPIFPMELYKKFFLTEYKSNDWDEMLEEAARHLEPIIHNDLFKEAIFLSSPSLYNNLDNFKSKNKKKREQVIKSVVRYVIRMTMRSTPYGVLSGVNLGKFGENSTLSIKKIKEHKKIARPDMHWLIKVITGLEKNDQFLLSLKLRRNPLYIENGSRVKLPFNTAYVKDSKYDINITTNSIRFTPVVNMVFRETEEPILYEDLLYKLKGHFNEVPIESIKNFLNQLIHFEYLITDLRPPLTETSPFDYILKRLQIIDSITYPIPQLKEIKDMLKQYNELEVGKGQQLLISLTQKMKNLAKVDNYLQVDLNVKKDELRLSKQLKNEIGQAAEVLCLLSHKDDSLEMSDYLNKFLEHYGTSREVPIAELLDPEVGLGLPEVYRTNDYEDRSTKSFNEIHKANLFSEWTMSAIRDKDIEICLDEDKLDQLIDNEKNYRNLPDSLDIYFHIDALSEKHIDNGEYNLVLGASAGSNIAGKTTGRFYHIIGNEFKEYFKNIKEVHQEIQKDKVIAELVYVPTSGRTANIVQTYNFREYEVVIGTNPANNKKSRIEIDDLVVGSTLERFYIRSKSLNKEVILTTNHMLNHKIAPPIYRFLVDISHSTMGNWSFLNWNSADFLPLIPRVKVGKVVLSPAQWKLNNGSLPRTENREWYRNFKRWKKQWMVPRYIYLTVGDNRLLLDLENPLHINELKRDFGKIKEGESLLLTEALGVFSSPLSSEEGCFNGEYVFSLYNKNKKVEKLPNYIFERNFGNIQNDNRRFLPGSEWLYLKLYGSGERQEELLVDFLYNKSSLFNQWSESFYFMRYVDETDHIRLRFQGSPKKLLNEGMLELNKHLEVMVSEGIISKFTIDTYEREIERYGGTELISYSEELFAIDTEFVLYWLAHIRSGDVNINKDILAVTSVMSYLKCFYQTLDEQIDWLNSRINPKKYMEEYRKLKRQLLVSNIENFSSVNQHIKEINSRREEVLLNYANKISIFNDKQVLTSTPEEILASIIHLHLNRFIGIDRNREIKILTLTRHTLLSLKHMGGL
ncbi:lantibiotic dehydratase [Evansella halocellulosilytica]|uniref:lantibiotic dehydratase n=1 Tax=Evansella halocellulosilytica TaxID=2011013 RepID=UPI0015C7F82E|nr:lantibiotic dehydratase [Evansella halocellulosilytica]